MLQAAFFSWSIAYPTLVALSVHFHIIFFLRMSASVYFPFPVCWVRGDPGSSLSFDGHLYRIMPLKFTFWGFSGSGLCKGNFKSPNTNSGLHQE